jgi:hypothetical protein
MLSFVVIELPFPFAPVLLILAVNFQIKGALLKNYVFHLKIPDLLLAFEHAFAVELGSHQLEAFLAVNMPKRVNL